MGLLMLAATAWALACPDVLPREYAFDEHSDGRVILVLKEAHALGVYERDALVSGTCFPITMGPAWDDGPKIERGDNRTPEGWYEITHRNPASKYHLSLGLNYPNADDVKRARERGVTDLATLGGDIFLHGNPHAFVNDWTWGCVALLNRDMDVIYRLGDPGTKVLILFSLAATRAE